MDLQKLKSDYERDGYVLLPSFIPPPLLKELRQTTHDFITRAKNGELSGAAFDVISQNGERDLRRITDPEKTAPAYMNAMKLDALVDVVSHLLGGTVRFDHGKLNFKPPSGGGNIEWHQDWAFYPQTNDDMLAAGILLEDCNDVNGPLLVIPGSHRGEVYDHHADGEFAGGINPVILGDLTKKAVSITAPAGSVSIHHVRTLHASGQNQGQKNRPLLLFNYLAADAFPVFHSYEWTEFNSRLLRGEPTSIPRMANVPVRVPQPAQPTNDNYSSGSIYDLQEKLNQRTVS